MTNVSNNVKVNAGKQPIYDCRIPMGTSISMTGSIFGGFNFGSSYGNFDFGNMDLMMPVWMTNTKKRSPKMYTFQDYGNSN